MINAVRRLICGAWIIAALLASTARGGDGVGNGDTIVVAGKEYKLADLYFKPYVGKSFSYDERLKTKLTKLRDDLLKWGLGNAGRFFFEHVFNDLVQYYFVDRLPDRCQDAMEVEDGLVPVQFACTRGWVTWIIPQYFERLSLEERVAAIVHERLHAFQPSQPHEVISPFVRGVVLFQKVVNLKPEDDCLTQEKVATLEEMMFSARQLGLADQFFKRYRLHPCGGGLVGRHFNEGSKDSEVASDVFLNYGSHVDSSRVESGSVLIDTQILNSEIEGNNRIERSQIGASKILADVNLKDAKVKESEVKGSNLLPGMSIAGVRFEAGAEVGNSSIENGSSRTPLIIASGARIVDSRIKGYGYQGGESGNRIESGARVEKSEIQYAGKLHVGVSTQLSNAKFYAKVVEFGDKTVVTDSFIRADGDRDYGDAIVTAAGVQVVKSNITASSIRLGAESDVSQSTVWTGMVLGAGDKEPLRKMVLSNSRILAKTNYFTNSDKKIDAVEIIDSKLEAKSGYIVDLVGKKIARSSIEARTITFARDETELADCKIASDRDVTIGPKCQVK